MADLASPSAPPYKPVDGRPADPVPPTYDPEAGAFAEYAAAFETRRVRDGFARRVLTIVAMQLALTAAGTACLMASPSARAYATASPALLLGAWGVALVATLALTCCPSLRRSHPHNLVGLAVFTLAYGFMIAVTTTFYQASTVALALAITAATVAATALIVTVKGVDYARHTGLLAVASWAFLVAVAASLFIRSSALMLALAAGGAALFAAYLLHDLALIMGGTSFLSAGAAARTAGAAVLDPDDAIWAAMVVYMDIASLFLQVLQLVQAAQDAS